MEEQVFSVSDFVAVFNQTISYAYPHVYVEGEVENFKVSKNKWVYFSLRDDNASVRFFGTIFHLPGPLEDGLKIRVKGTPFLHPLYGFSINVSLIKPVGEGSIKKAAKLLETKLKSEGLFELSRKRTISYPPKKIGLITSVGSAAYHDFIKIINERWSGLDIRIRDVQVQGEVAAAQIIEALNRFNNDQDLVEVVVVIRGGGSVEDLSTFNEEHLVRSIASSRVPTLVAIGHEIDISLAELVADRRCSTPTHAAETLTPDKTEILNQLKLTRTRINNLLENRLVVANNNLDEDREKLIQNMNYIIQTALARISDAKNLLDVLNPKDILKRGYAIIRKNGKLMQPSKLSIGDELNIETYSSKLDVEVKRIKIIRE